MKRMNGNQLIEAFESASNSMSNNIERIDAMNVFPVPDGDTGSNMGATIAYATAEIKKLKKDQSISDVTSKFARGMLLGARGNSGVILSQIFKGFSIALKNKNTASSFDLVEAFNLGREYAYKSVIKPIEGTILTVIRLVYENLSKNVTPSDTIEVVISKATKFAKEACELTPTMLPVLKEVGVTDSGGEGLYMILVGMESYFKGKPIQISRNNKAEIKDFLINGEEDFNGEYGYCTEFITFLKSPKIFKQDRFKVGLEKHGSSIVMVVDEDILKVHLHTLNPGAVLTFAQKFGDFMKIKSENMTLQANESNSAAKQRSNYEAGGDKSPKLEIGVVSCNAGPGIISEMQSLGTDFIIEAGQTSNPSAQDFIKAIDSLNTDQIILLPNNSNIIMAAQQAASISKKKIIVIPTKTQMEGLSAIMNFDRTMPLSENQEAMNDAISEVKTGQVTKASRTTRIDGVSVKSGEFLAIAGKKIIGSLGSPSKAAMKISKEFIDEDTDLVTIFYGDDSSLTDAEEVASYIETNYSAETEIKDGKQPIYNFLIAFE